MARFSATGINLSDYSRLPSAKGWGSPCSGQRATVRLAEALVTVDIRIAELTGLVMLSIERDGYRFRKADTGAYNCRKIAGTATWSNHAWAIAIDGNWQTNPYTKLLKTDYPAWVVERFNRYGFAWGGHYSGRKDAMHWEAMGTPAQMQAALELARRELGKAAVAPIPAPTAPGVRAVQDRLNGLGFGPLVADGISGPATEAAARRFQAAAGITVDGDFGELSWATSNKVPAYPGENLRAFQQRLRDRGWTIAVDGEPGPQTTRVLTAFQQEKGLDADGQLGPMTWTALWTRGA